MRDGRPEHLRIPCRLDGKKEVVKRKRKKRNSDLIQRRRYMDGTSHSDRLFWMLHSGSASFLAGSWLRLWCGQALRP